MSQCYLVRWIAFTITAVGFSLGFLCMFKAIEWAGGPPTAMLLNLEPVFALTLAAVLLDQQPDLAQVIGSAMVVGAVIIGESMRASQAQSAGPKHA